LQFTFNAASKGPNSVDIDSDLIDWYCELLQTTTDHRSERGREYVVGPGLSPNRKPHRNKKVEDDGEERTV